MNDAVLLERCDAVATLTLNRPAALNTLDYPMIDALVAHTAAVAADDAVRVVVVRGAGKHFMAGGDIRVFSGELHRPGPERRLHFQRMVEQVHAAFETLHRMPRPVIAQVHGAVAGIGLSLMNACDLVVAGESAYFSSAYRQIALTPDGGGSFALTRLVGLRKAMEIMLLSERFDVRRAADLGLVNQVVPDVELQPTVDALARSLAEGPALALANTKRLVRESLEHSLSEQLQAEAVSFGEAAGTADFAEGITAFLEKRPPRFAKS